MSTRSNLSRWNRASLSRFRYVDGNAVEYLELLRQQLVKHFVDPTQDNHTWLKPDVIIPEAEEKQDNETLTQRQQRLSRKQERILDMYQHERRDWAWEISRTFARACHILTEYTNAYANEGYLGTATQWEHVRRLVEMLDYHPAPPASASTKLVLEAKKSKYGLVKKGWQTKYKPPEGGDKIIFETLDDLHVHHELNGLRLRGFDQSPDPLGPINKGGLAKWRWLTSDNGDIEELELSAGNIALLLNTPLGKTERAIAVTIEDVDNQNNTLTLSGVPMDIVSEKTEKENEKDGWQKGQTQLFVSAKDIITPRLHSEGVITFEQPHSLIEGDIIAWKTATGWTFDSVTKSDGLSVKLQTADPLPASKTEIYQCLNIAKPEKDEFKFPYDFESAAKQSKGRFIALAASDYEKIQITKTLEEIKKEIDLSGYKVDEATLKEVIHNSHSRIINTRISEIYILPIAQISVGKVQASEPVQYLFDGSPGDLASGQWVVAETKSDYLPLKIQSIKEYEDHFQVIFDAKSLVSGNSTIIEQAVTHMDKEIKRLQPLLVEPAMAQIKLGDLISGDVAKCDVGCIQGVGPQYTEILKGSHNKFTIGELADIDPNKLDIPISKIRLNEFKTNAQNVMNFSSEAKLVDSLSEKTLTSLLETPTKELAKKVKQASEEKKKPSDSSGEIKRLYGPFESTLYPDGHDGNKTELTEQDTNLELAKTLSAEALVLLKSGRPLMLEHEDNTGKPVAVTLSKIDKGKLTLSRKLESIEGFTLGNLIIRANVALSGHGESKPEKILGSGNAMTSSQSFLLAVAGVAFTADATKSTGVAAALNVSVDNQIWHQVSTLKDSTPGDPHYAIRMTEQGHVRVLFGDGEYARRLPSGSDNVRVRYRVGSGLAGNVPAGGLEKPVNPHPLIESVRQPLRASGGGDMEEVSSLRENAPSTLLALERAVSLSDFSQLAAAQSSVWQAKAYGAKLHAGKTENVRVVIVPADGVISEDIEDKVGDFLQQHALPAVHVVVESFEPVLFDLNISARVKFDEFVAEEVEKAVISAITDHFKLKYRTLGEHLYLSEVYKVVEGIVGVENSVCVLNNDEALQLVRADDDRMVVYLDTLSGSTLYVEARRYKA